MHGPNRIMREIRLRSGQKVFEFMRSTFHWGGISFDDNASGLAEVLRDEALSRLVEREGVSLIYTHLGKFKRNCNPLCPSTKQALKLLSQYSRAGKILVTTTHRILRYCRTISDLKLSVSANDNHLSVEVTTKGSEKDLEGLSLYVPTPDKTRIIINGLEIKNFQCNAPDHTGHSSVSLPWHSLKFPGS